MDVRENYLSSRQRKTKALGFFICIVAVGALFFWQDQQVKQTEQEIAEKKTELKNIERSKEDIAAEFEQILSEREKVKDERQLLSRKISLLHQSRQKSASWSTALIQISELMPTEMWLKKVYLTDEGVTVGGASLDNGVISKFMSKLDASPLFKDTDFKYIQKIDIEDVPYIEFEVTTDVVLSEIKR